jgi:hypothetical protein
MARLFFDVMKLNITNMTVIHTDMLSGWSEWRRVPATSTNAFVALTGKHRFFKLTVVAP